MSVFTVLIVIFHQVLLTIIAQSWHMMRSDLWRPGQTLLREQHHFWPIACVKETEHCVTV